MCVDVFLYRPYGFEIHFKKIKKFTFGFLFNKKSGIGGEFISSWSWQQTIYRKTKGYIDRCNELYFFSQMIE